MELILAAIDLVDGGAVRLVQGDFDRQHGLRRPPRAGRAVRGRRRPLAPRGRPRRRPHRRPGEPPDGAGGGRGRGGGRRAGRRPVAACAREADVAALLEAGLRPGGARHRRPRGPGPGRALRPALPGLGGRGPRLPPPRRRAARAGGPGLAGGIGARRWTRCSAGLADRARSPPWW